MHPVPAVLAPLIWHDVLLPRLRLGIRGRTAANLAFSLGYSAAAGRRARWFGERSARWTAVAAGVPAAGVLAGCALPPVRRALARRADGRTPAEFAEWLLVHIPFGTVFVEEQLFRATLDPLLIDAYGPRIGAALGVATFGLWHVHPARAAGDSVPATVLATTVAGIVFGALARRGGVSAAAAAHLAINAGGAVLTRLPRRTPFPDPHPFSGRNSGADPEIGCGEGWVGGGG